MPHTVPNAPVLYVFPSSTELVDGLAQFIAKAQKESIEKKGRFTIALSGGSLPKQLSGLVDNPAIKWDKWYVPSVLTCPPHSLCFARARNAHTMTLANPIADRPQARLLRRRARRPARPRGLEPPSLHDRTA